MVEVTITAPFTGSVLVHSVSVGQEILEGQSILIMESMKTELSVDSHVKGRISWLESLGKCVDVGDAVARVSV